MAGILELQRLAGNGAVTTLIGAHRSAPWTVQRDLEAIERELKREFGRDDDARLAERRQRLEAQFRSLNASESWELSGRIFQPVGADKVADRFQRLARPTRTALLHIIFDHLDHLQAESLAGDLRSTRADGVAKRLRARFGELVPERGLQKKLLGVLDSRFAAAHQSVPGRPVTVRLTFRDSGPVTAENTCTACDDIGPLGVNWGAGQNAMELRGDIAGPAEGIQYDFKRTREVAGWQKDTAWTTVQYDPPGTDDDHNNADEMLIPKQGHIYAVDSPGPFTGNDPGWPYNQNARGCYAVHSFVEWVEAKAGNGSWQRVSDPFEWHSQVTLKNVNRDWQRDRNGLNEIAPGPVEMLSPDGQMPSVKKSAP